MKAGIKNLVMLLAVVCLTILFLPVEKTFAANSETVIDTKYGVIINDKTISRVDVVGTYREDNSQFAENIKILIKDVKTNKTVLTIKPKTNAGYGPSIIIENFTGGKLSQIFLGINSGGSGGYGYFYVFSVENKKTKTLFDYENWKYNYTANYIDGYKVKVSSEDGKQNYLIDLSLRDKEYLSQIYNSDGTLIKPVQGGVSAINTVFPYFNSTQNIFQLQVMQRITGLYNADGLGYVINQLEYKDGKFIPYFTMVGIL